MNIQCLIFSLNMIFIQNPLFVHSCAYYNLESLLIVYLHRLITKQTPPGGVPVSKVMVAEAIDITRETYFCILMDREYNGPVIIASPDGGVDIEEVAEKTPDRIKKMAVDIHTGVTDAMATELAEFLGIKFVYLCLYSFDFFCVSC